MMLYETPLADARQLLLEDSSRDAAELSAPQPRVP